MDEHGGELGQIIAHYSQRYKRFLRLRFCLFTKGFGTEKADK
jgi:hypothetical protein